MRTLARTFHQLVQRYSKLCQAIKHAEKKKSRQKERKACHQDFWKFAKNILDENGYTSIAPTFSKETAEEFFKSIYKAMPKSFSHPDWMPDAPPPQVPFEHGEITAEEIQYVIKKCKASSTPSPVDQVHYCMLKNCPSLMPALYTSVLKRRWMYFMSANKYLNTTIQKAFIDGISGCTEHHIKLLSIIKEACKKYKALGICWLDLANAYGSVQHNLIQYSLRHYHAPDRMIAAVPNLYQGLVGIVQTKEWTTEPFPLQIGIYQGDPLSVIIFNTVINTLVDSISQSLHHLFWLLIVWIQSSLQPAPVC